MQMVKLMYDRTDLCRLSDTSELNVVRRRQRWSSIQSLAANEDVFILRQRKCVCACIQNV